MDDADANKEDQMIWHYLVGTILAIEVLIAITAMVVYAYLLFTRPGLGFKKEQD